MSKFFIADLHFGGTYSHRFYGRPFKTYAEYEDTMLRNLQATLSSKDDLYILGDFIDYKNSPERCGSWEYAISLVGHIPGKKHLILGNNEERLIRANFLNFNTFKVFCLGHGFCSCDTDALISVKGNVFFLNHYIEHCREDVLNLYGHMHRDQAVSIKGFNVSCDVLGYYPLSEDQLITIFERALSYSLPHGHIPGGKYINKELWDKYRQTWIKQINCLYN